MYNGPVRAGTRGGAAEFKWADVAQDKDRENYLGHSINAPAGRWQKNKDIHWYAREGDGTEEERREEIRKVKEAEEDALAVALGFKPAVRVPQVSPTASRAEGETPLRVKPDPDAKESADAAANEAKAVEKAERRVLKEERRARKAERRARKEERRRERGAGERSVSPRPGGDWDREGSRTSEREVRRELEPTPPRRTRRDRSPSRVPPRTSYDRYADRLRRGVRSPSRSRSRSPDRRRSPGPNPRDSRDARERDRYERDSRAAAGRKAYDEEEMRRERERDRRRWEGNAERDRPGSGAWGRR